MDVRVPPRCNQVPYSEKVPIVNKENEVLVVPSDITNEEVRGELHTLAAKT